MFLLCECEVYMILGQDQRTHLVEVMTSEQMEVLVELMNHEAGPGQNTWWSGATDIGREGAWIWAYSLLPVGDFIWYLGGPNGGTGENYMCFADGYDYMGADCFTDYAYAKPICQKSIN